MSKVELILNDESIPNYVKDVLKHFYKDGMSDKDVFNCLTHAHFIAFNAGYCDSMAWKLMSGEQSYIIDEWEYACDNKYTISHLCELLKD